MNPALIDVDCASAMLKNVVSNIAFERLTRNGDGF